MSNRIIVGVAALNQTPMDWEHNYAHIIRAIIMAQGQQVKVLCLPELCISGYGCEDAFFSKYVQEKSLEKLHCLCNNKCTSNMIITVGLPLVVSGVLYNCAAIIDNGQCVGIVPKQNLANDGIHYESRWFKPWKAGQQIQLDNYGLNCPFGDLIFDQYGFGLGVEICEDAWVPNRPGISLAQRGADFILNPSASHFSFGKRETRRNLVTESSRSLHCTYLYANLLGNEAGRIIYDGHSLIASNGSLLAENQKRCSFEDVNLVTAVVDVNRTRTSKLVSGTFCPAVSTSGNSGIVRTDRRTDKPCTEPLAPSKPIPKFREFENAASLALFDYMRKSHSHGFVLSLSGGADSSAVAYLVRMMLDKGRSELGDIEFANKCSIPELFGSNPIRQILTCIYQGTENSSMATLNSARHLATELGATFINWSVEDVKNIYTQKVECALGRTLTWERDDITLQNIQARVRAPGIWMIANIKKALLLSTSNRSEAAVGYATMDGDTCGGLAPIAGVDKEFILAWLKDVNDYSLRDYYALTPTAELRPKSMEQTDEKDLMPYSVLRIIEECAIRDKMTSQDIVQVLNDKNIDGAEEYVKKFWSLWTRNQWKRERYAPSFHFDDENLDPKSWCRWPILSGNIF
jgi:NAD+ synthase (glutamine-hydrolysing)